MSNKNLPRKKRSKIYLVPVEDLREVVKNSNSISAILKYFNISSSSGSYSAIKNRFSEENIDFTHIKLGLDSNRGRTGFYLPSIPLEQVLVEHSTYGRTSLKSRLLKNDMLKNQCYECGIGPEWNGKPLSLQIDHINGVSDDNRIENLRILCPNCHAQTDTFGSKRCKKDFVKPPKLDPDLWHHRKIEWPSKELLAVLLEQKPILQIAQDYKVASSTIIRWAKRYELTTYPHGYWQKLIAETKVAPFTKDQLKKLLWEMSGNNICKEYKIAKQALAKWIKYYDLTRPPAGYWKKKINNTL